MMPTRGLWVGLAAVVTTGCAHTVFPDRAADWDAIHMREPPPFVSDLTQKGYRACTRMLTATAQHALGDAQATLWSGRRDAEELDRRPVTYTMVAGKGADTAHVVITTGVDGSGKCFSEWHVTRVWPASCDTLYKKAEWLQKYQKTYEADSTSLYQNPDSTIEVFLTRVGRDSCLMTEGEISYHVGKDVDMSLDDMEHTQ